MDAGVEKKVGLRSKCHLLNGCLGGTIRISIGRSITVVCYVITRMHAYS